MNAVYAKDSSRKSQVYAFDKNSYRLPIPQSVIDANDKVNRTPDIDRAGDNIAYNVFK